MPSLMVTPPIEFLPTGQNSILPVLRWDIEGQRSIYFWYKKNNKGKWRAAIYDTDSDTPHKFVGPTGSSELGQRNGTRDKKWGTGRYVFVGFVSQDADPNSNPSLDDPPPLIRADLVILRDSAALLQNTAEDWGNTGTQIDAFARGVVPDGKPTYAVLRVDTAEPQHPDGTVEDVAYPPSWLDFPSQRSDSPGDISPLTSPQPTEFQGLSLDHAPISVASRYFLPGKAYWALLLVYTEDGQWQIKKKQLTMLRRIVEISFREISISNDGAEGDGRAYFHWWVVDRDKIARFYRTGTIPISDRPSPGEEWKEHIGLSTYIPEEDTPVLRFGPYSVDEDKYNRCLILTRAIGKHPTGTDDKSGNVARELGAVGTTFEEEFSNGSLEFRIGADNERYENVRFAIEAENVNEDDDDNEFSYVIRGLYSVDYEP